HLRLHPRLDGRYIRLAEVREDVPGTVVHQSDDLLALPGVLAYGDVQVRHVAVEGRAQLTVANVELGRSHARLGGLPARVEITDLGQEVFSPRLLVVRLVDRKGRITASGHGVVDRGGSGPRASSRFLQRGRADVTSATGLGHAIRRHEPALEQWLHP